MSKTDNPTSSAYFSYKYAILIIGNFDMIPKGTIFPLFLKEAIAD